MTTTSITGFDDVRKLLSEEEQRRIDEFIEEMMDDGLDPASIQPDTLSRVNQ